MSESTSDREHPSALIPLGPEVLVIRNRYESLSMANALTLGVWLTIGSVLSSSEATTTAATALFLLGSVQMLIRPVIRLSRRSHLRCRGYDESGTQQDF